MISTGKVWVLCLLICVIATAVSFTQLDVPIAHLVYPLSVKLGVLGANFGSAVILSMEAAVVLTLITTRLARGHLSPFGEALGLACLTSICTYSLNAGVLKTVCGVPNPLEVLQGAKHAFHLFHGSPGSSFPSGHMVLAAAFAGVFMRLFKASILPLSALLLAGASLLILGDWHFLSDTVFGAFIGVSAGLLAGELWVVHSNRDATAP